VDGYRCDAAPMVPIDFWEQARSELVKVKPDLMLLDEGENPELMAKAFDLDYSWKLLWAMNDVLLHDASAEKIRHSWEDSRAHWPSGALRMRISDDHDETRAVTRYGMKGALAASALMFTLDGVPLLYNGMEVGDATESAEPALFCKLNICWHPHQSERPQFRSIYHDLIKLRKQYPAFHTDGVTWLPNSDPANLVTFSRHDDNDEFVVIINFSNRPINGSVDLPEGQGFKRVKITGMTDGVGFPRFHMNGFDWQIYHRTIRH